MVKIINESDTRQATNAISAVIGGMHTTLSELDAIIEDSANSDKLLSKKDVTNKVADLSKSLSAIRSILKSYTPDNRAQLSRDSLEEKIYRIYDKYSRSTREVIEEFLLSHGADQANNNMFDGVSTEDLRKLYNILLRSNKQLDIDD